jgi:hypothetical protein
MPSRDFRNVAGLDEVEPGGVREMHWHPNTDEWQYYIEIRARVRGFSPDPHAQIIQHGEVIASDPELAVGGANLKGPALAHNRDPSGSTARACSGLSPDGKQPVVYAIPKSLVGDKL